MKVLITLALVAAVVATPFHHQAAENNQIQNREETAAVVALLSELENLDNSDHAGYNSNVNILNILEAIKAIIRDIIKKIIEAGNNKSTPAPSTENPDNRPTSTEQLGPGLESSTPPQTDNPEGTTPQQNDVQETTEISTAGYQIVSEDGVLINNDETAGSGHSESSEIGTENEGSGDLSGSQLRIVNSPNALARQSSRSLYQTQYNPRYQTQYNPIYQTQYNPRYQPQYNPRYQ